MNEVKKIKVEKNLKESLKALLKDLGGISLFVKPGDIVLIKPNFNTADPFPASTDFAFLKAVTEIVYEEGPQQIIIGDSSTMSLDTRKVMEELNIFGLEKIGKRVKVVVFEEEKWVKRNIPSGKYLKSVTVPAILEKIDKLILLPCLKTHSIAQFTGALKLSVGFMKPWQRSLLHLRRIQEKIAELNFLINPNLIIMDARKCFINQGPSKGEVQEPNLILASTSRLAIDIEGIKLIQSYPGNSLLNIKPEELPQIRRAQELGIR